MPAIVTNEKINGKECSARLKKLDSYIQYDASTLGDDKNLQGECQFPENSSNVIIGNKRKYISLRKEISLAKNADIKRMKCFTQEQERQPTLDINPLKIDKACINSRMSSKVKPELGRMKLESPKETEKHEEVNKLYTSSSPAILFLNCDRSEIFEKNAASANRKSYVDKSHLIQNSFMGDCQQFSYNFTDGSKKHAEGFLKSEDEHIEEHCQNYIDGSQNKNQPFLHNITLEQSSVNMNDRSREFEGPFQINSKLSSNAHTEQGTKSQSPLIKSPKPPFLLTKAQIKLATVVDERHQDMLQRNMSPDPESRNRLRASISKITKGFNVRNAGKDDKTRTPRRSCRRAYQPASIVMDGVVRETHGLQGRNWSNHKAAVPDRIEEVPKKKMSEQELWKRFEKVFKRYARTRRHSGEVIPRKISTLWMRQMGVVGRLLSERDADEAFKRAAGSKITMNVKEYKEFLITLTMKLKLPFYEIYRSMCDL